MCGLRAGRSRVSKGRLGRQCMQMSRFEGLSTFLIPIGFRVAQGFRA